MDTNSPAAPNDQQPPNESDSATQSSESRLNISVGERTGVGGDVVTGDKSISQDAGGDIVGGNKTTVLYPNPQTRGEIYEKDLAVDLRFLTKHWSGYLRDLQAQVATPKQFARGKSFKALDAYQLEDANAFFGREQAVQGLLQQLHQSRYTVLQSESGAGKTSLLKAGIMPALIQQGHLPIYLRLIGRSPVTALKEALTPGIKQTPSLASTSVRNILHKVCELIGPEKSVYILFDQFEELFLFADDAQQSEFVESLAECLDVPVGLNVNWLFSLRAEFFVKLGGFRPHIRHPFSNDYHLSELTQPEAKEIVVKSAELAGIRFEETLVDLILDDLGKKEVAPPQLQIVCSELYKELGPDQTIISKDMYDKNNGAAGILRNYLERVLSQDLEPIEQRAARRVLESLISSEAQRVIRKHGALVAELQSRGITPTTLDTILRYLVDNRLLRVVESREEDNEQAFEIVHDYLLGDIKLSPEVQARKAAQELLEQEVIIYRRHHALLSRERVEIIKPYRGDIEFTSEAELLFQASLDAIDKADQDADAQRQELVVELARADEAGRSAYELRRRNRIISAVGALAILSTVIAFWLYAVATQQTRLATAQHLAAAAVSRLQTDPELSILLAQQAVAATYPRDKNPALEAVDALHQAMLASHIQFTLRGHTDLVNDVAYSPDGTHIATASSDNTVRIWDATSGQTALTITGHTAPVSGVAYSPDGSRLVTSSFDHTVRVWNAVTGKELLVLTGHSSIVFDVTFSPDGARIGSASADGTAKVWDAITGHELLTLTGHSNLVRAIAFSPDGTRIATGSDDQTAKVWDAKTGHELMTLADHIGTIGSVVYSPNGAWIVTGSSDGTAKIWDSNTGQLLLTLVNSGSGFSGLAFDSAGKRLAVADGARTITVWNVTTGQQMFTIDGHTGPVVGVRFSPDDRHLVSASWDHTARIWDATPGHAGPITAIAYSTDSTRIATGSTDKTVIIWDALHEEPLLTLVGHTDAIGAVAFSPNGALVASASNDRTVRVWDAKTGQPRSTLFGLTLEATDVVFNPDGTRIAASSGFGTIVIWDVVTGNELLTWRHPDQIVPVLGVAYSPDGARLASAAAEGTTKIWDASSGRLLLTLTGHTLQVTHVSFSPDGKRLVTTSMDGTAKIWDANDGKVLLTFMGHGDIVSSAQFTPDGASVMTSSADHSIRLWDSHSGKELLTITGIGSGFALSPDGISFAIGGDDKRVRVHRFNIDTMIAESQMRVTRKLSTQECQQYLGNVTCVSVP